MTGKIIKTKFKHGDIIHGVTCKKCELPFPLASDLDEIPDPFSAKCFRCGHIGSYLKRKIQHLEVHLKQ